MKSTIRIKTDYATDSRIPIIEVRHVESDDPRDLMIQDFLNMVSDNNYLCILELTSHPQFTHQLRPIPASDILHEWWLEYVNKSDDERNSLKFKKSSRGRE